MIMSTLISLCEIMELLNPIFLVSIQVSSLVKLYQLSTCLVSQCPCANLLYNDHHPFLQELLLLHTISSSESASTLLSSPG